MPSKETLLITPDTTATRFGSVSFPIFQTATYENRIFEKSDYSYTRCSNPTRTELERVCALSEGAKYCLAFSSGLAAVSAVLCLCENGDRVLASLDLYGGTYRLLRDLESRCGLSVCFGDTDHPEDFAEHIDPKTRLVFIETPTNPLMKVTDIQKIADYKKERTLLVCDNTFLSPVFQNPLRFGADIVIHSATKYICGHHDTSAGLVITNDSTVYERLNYMMMTYGNGLSPFDCFLIRRGIETLFLRMQKHDSNAKEVFAALNGDQRIKKIYFVGDPKSKYREITQKQTSGYGGMISFVLSEKIDISVFIRSLKLIRFAESLGGNASLITHPFTQTHASVPEDERIAAGIIPSLLRLSVGTENSDDIIHDLLAALDTAERN